MNLTRRSMAGISGLGLAAAQMPRFDPNSVSHRFVQTNGIKMHIAELGSGPLVLLIHGFPESWYSWRNQFVALANAGFHVVAPDMRGYGKSDIPPEISSYSLMHMTGDVIGLVSALGRKQAVIIGHDWGATVAWHAALFRPDVFPLIATMSVPFRLRGPAPPMRLLREQGLHTYYWLYYQDVGVADAEYDRNVRESLRRTLYSLSGDFPRGRPNIRILQPGKGVLDNTINPDRLPAWLTEADLDYMAADLARAGFRGGLNWYRNIDRNWELLAPWAGLPVRQRALFIAGSEDHVINGPTGKAPLEAMATSVPNLERKLILDGAGHYIQQERSAEVNKALLEFLRGPGVPPA